MRPAAYDLFRIRSLAETDLEKLHATEVDGVKAAEDMLLAGVAKRVIPPEELLVIASEGLLEASDLQVAAGMPLPEGLHLCFVHGGPFERPSDRQLVATRGS